jgi:hypothetical protein
VLRPDDNARLPAALRLLAWLLIFWEPLAFAAAAAGAINAIAVRGVGVALVLAVRLITTALSVAAGRALLDRRDAGVRLACVALPSSAAVQLFAALTRYFPSNRVPGDAPIYATGILTYYGGWLLYLILRRPTGRDSS